MRNLLAFLLFAGAAASLPPQKSGPTPAPMHASIVDSHEGLTIGVDPWTQSSRYKEKFPKKSPLSGGVVAIRVSFRNGNEQSIKVDLRSIRLLVQFSEDSRQQLAPLSAEDVADTVLLKENAKDPTAKRSPLPIPIGKSRPSRDANWTNLRDACQNAAVPTSVLAAHDTVEGLIYFDLRGEVELLQSSRLYIPNLVTMGDNQPLSYFDIDLGQNSSN
jgi:hypothetical protein